MSGPYQQRQLFYRDCLVLAFLHLRLVGVLCAQTTSSGAVTGVTLDPSGSVLPGVSLQLLAKDTPGSETLTSDQHGWFVFSSVVPGTYELRARKRDFKPLIITDLQVHVTETSRLELHLEIATHVESTQVSSKPLMVQLDSSTLGRTVNKTDVDALPLVSRNFTQIAGLSSGILSGVYNAGELGTGRTPLSQTGKSNDGIYAHGARSYANNWQMDGISVSDVISSGTASGGIPIPNPDVLEEFKVQTALYDAAFGRASGANVSVVTRKGGDRYHGSFFEYLRNKVFNANDFFLNKTGQPRADLKQNQFGFALGGPIQKDRVFFFASYQGTRQVNGLAAGQSRIACGVSLAEPPLTNDRSSQALGQLFAGMKGALGGVAVNADGSNINPIALTLLNYKLPNGSFLIPTPQVVDPSKPLAIQGFSAFSEPCHFNEDQYLLNLDYMESEKNHLAARFFIERGNQTVTFPGNGLNTMGNISGFQSPGNSDFVVFSLADTHVLNSSRLNEARIGYVRAGTGTGADAPFAWSAVGVSEGDMNANNELPSLKIMGSISMAPGFPRTYTQNSFVFSDVFSLQFGRQNVRFGGTLTRLQENLDFLGFGSYLEFLSWPDFLLGLNARNNGSAFSNVFASEDVFGLLNREFRAWEGSAFVQDDYRIKKSVTLGLGLRYERLGQFGDQLGRSSSFDFGKANPEPSVQGSLDGYVVASNFQSNLPPGVIRAPNQAGTYGQGQNTIAPRIGFAWEVFPQTFHLTLRSGYGIYYSRPTGQDFSQSVIAAPFADTRISTGVANSDATFHTPFAEPFPTPGLFPLFAPYSPTTNLGISALAANFRPEIVQQYSLNVQAELASNWLLEIGYVGARGTHLQRLRSLNQALSASPEDPINGVTSNTLTNIRLRVPVPGIRPDSLREMESEGSSWYNGLEVSLTKRLNHGFQFLASYTFSKTLDTDGADINGVSGGNVLTLGNQNSPSERWGRSSIDRPQRLVFSGTWSMPTPRAGLQHTFFGGWNLSTVITIQPGTALTIGYTNANNVFGISRDRAQLSGACRKNQIVSNGAIESKLNDYFNVACFTAPPIIGADGIGTGFGDSGTGIVDGPGQANVDLAVSKTTAVKWPVEEGAIQFRAEFFNALNHAQFANPDTTFGSPTFGVIDGTAVNPRVTQFALKFLF